MAAPKRNGKRMGMENLGRRRLVLKGLLLGAMAMTPRLVHAAATGAVALSAQDRAVVDRVVAYLNNIHTMESRFEQIAGDGSNASGMIYVERPGKLRLQYDPPMPVMIIADGRGIYYWDSKLEQLSETRVEDTPAWFLLRPDIRASEDVRITQFQHQPGMIRLTMVESAHPELGSVTLALADEPLELRQWTIVDAQARPVTVTLTDPRFGMAIPPLMFDWIDPRITQGRIPH
jgi:outer membrane lipoprotein-sorting protein